jgi:hypothetical protein
MPGVARSRCGRHRIGPISRKLLFSSLFLPCLSGCAGSIDNAALTGSNAPNVVMTAQFADVNCKSIVLAFGLPGEGGFQKAATVTAKSRNEFGRNYDERYPQAERLAPGEYRLLSITCMDQANAMHQFGQAMRFLDTTYKFTFGTLQVPNAPLVFAGHIVLHSEDRRVTGIEVRDMLPETKAALQVLYPTDFPRLQKSLVRLDGGSRGPSGVFNDDPNSGGGISATVIVTGR